MAWKVPEILMNTWSQPPGHSPSSPETVTMFDGHVCIGFLRPVTINLWTAQTNGPN